MPKNKPLICSDLSKNLTWGIGITERNQCIHYQTLVDVVAIRLKCCSIYYACILCHAEMADHPPIRWSQQEFEEKVVLCGYCHTYLTINAYLQSHPKCPSCHGPFNPGCAAHHHLYFSPGVSGDEIFEEAGCNIVDPAMEGDIFSLEEG